jgi:diguanylate cyclase (GGDEF)-like protein
MESRAHKRYFFDQQATLEFTPSNTIEGRILNYGEGGFLIQLNQNLADIAAAQQLNLFSCFKIKFNCVIEGYPKEIILQGHIRRMEDLLVGIEFYQAPATTIALINQFVTKYLSSNPRPAEAQTRKKHPQLLAQINNIEKSFWSFILKQFYSEVEEQLIQLADRAQTNQQQALCFESINQLKAHHDQTINSIGRLVSQYLETPIQIPKQEEVEVHSDDHELEILEKNQFEDWLEVQIIISAAESDNFTSLQQLHQYLSQLYETEIAALNNPLGPHVICHTFRQTLADSKFPRPILKVIYKCFQKPFLAQLSHFYNELIALFTKSGFKVTSSTQNLVNGNRQVLQQITGQTNVKTEQEHNASGKIASSTSQRSNTYHSLQSLKNLQHVNTGYTGSQQTKQTHDKQDYFSLSEINQWFNKLPLVKTHTLSASQRPLKEVFLQDLKGFSGQSSESKHINSEQLGIIEIIDDIFGLMKSRHELDEEFQGWVNQLKIPLLKVLLNDPEFLDNPQHPARQVVNQLIQIGSVDRVTNKSLERTVKKHIDTIVSEYSQNNHIFSTVSIALQSLIDRQENAFKRNAERVAKAYEGQEKLAHAKQYVLTKLVKLLVGRKIPSVVLDLINEGWRSLLVVTCLREGIQSTDLKEYFTILEALVIWTQSHNVVSGVGDEFELDLEAPAVLELISQQLSNTSTGIITHQALLDELQCLLYRKRDPKLITIEETELGFDISLLSQKETKKVSPSPESTNKTTSNLKDSRWLKRVDNMKVGDWVEYQDEQTKVKRMRLIWTGDDAYKFVFVNHQGMKEIEFDAEQLVNQLDSGKTVLVDESEISFVDKSLFNTVQTVYEQMAFRATHDPLTELMERHEFEKYLNRALAKTHKRHTLHALCHIDIIQFSIINNNYGHHVGDRLLKAIAELLNDFLKGGHVLARVGGNEYGILINHCNEQEAINIADQIRSTLNNHEFIIQDNTITINASVGLELITPESQTISTILKHADLACMSAKQGAGNKVVQYSESDSEQIHQDSVMSWAGKVDNALSSKDLLQVRCQKIAPVNSPDTDSPHYEILLGVLDDAGKLISPEGFIEAAEQFNRMPKVDRWVVTAAFEWMENNLLKVEQLHGFSINLSGHSINDDSFLEFLLNKIKKSSVTTEKICFEVTETATISNLNYAADFINEVKKLGCKFSLDDFGTGLASYEYLQKLPVDYLKIDGIFIKDIVKNTNNYAMVKSINELGHFLGKETIAEYVENDEILEVLKEIGVDYAQGYGVEKPILLNTL